MSDQRPRLRDILLKPFRALKDKIHRPNRARPSSSPSAFIANPTHHLATRLSFDSEPISTTSPLVSITADPVISTAFTAIPSERSAAAIFQPTPSTFLVNPADGPTNPESVAVQSNKSIPDIEILGSRPVVSQQPAVLGLPSSSFQVTNSGSGTMVNTDSFNTNIYNTTQNFLNASCVPSLKEHAIAGAAFNTQERQFAPFLSETRAALLEKISDWADDPNASPICWLYGLAGSGKTTAASAIAAMFTDRNRLAGTFFFSRDHSDRRVGTKVFTTIAYDLSIFHPTIGETLRQILDRDPRIPGYSWQLQLEKLILSSLKSSTALSSPIIVVLDALDECDTKDALELVRVLVEAPATSLIRFLLTSRADDDIQGKFRPYPNKVFPLDLMDFRAHDDIHKFFHTRLSALYQEHCVFMPDVEAPWPSDADLAMLVKKSEGLFIYASTVIKFVGDLSDEPVTPADRLKQAMEHHTGLDGLYRQVLKDAPFQSNLLFKDILGTLLVLYDPLPLSGLANFLHPTSISHILLVLKGCRAILQIPNPQLPDPQLPDPQLPNHSKAEISFLHASLPDFLMDFQRAGEYYTDLLHYHIFALDHCIQIIKRQWCQSDLGDDGSSRNYQQDAFSYACKNWHFHLAVATKTKVGMDQIQSYCSNQFATALISFVDHIGSDWFLHWMDSDSIPCYHAVEAFEDLMEKVEVSVSLFLPEC
ncbi:hypothetical protein BYT27DRAFT_7247679 [Phlegmacium glaucopus]|nr:hypothetical protein BYT27DRAFT_7247679 [Phlegmacium glaucopus]